ncbi:hypothetical protein BHM03_00058571 [Ensete ventricosum]|nr:hypothetical protein BHM03_00058571 [Ensete ventricosum]
MRSPQWGRLQGARKVLPPAASRRGGGASCRGGCQRARATAACSLPDSFSQFIINFNMNKFEVTLPKLLNILRETKSVIKKKPFLYIGETKKKRKTSKTLKKGKGKERPGKTKVAKRDPVKDKGQCFHCGQDGHWKMNCKDDLVD